MKDAPIEDRWQGNGNDPVIALVCLSLELTFVRFIVLPVIGLLTFNASRDP
jgi:hypothetical protein